MDDTVHPTTDREPPPSADPVVTIVGQLRGAGVDTSTRAVRVLGLHAHRRELTREQIVEILARFPQCRWDGRTQEVAQRLLRDISQPYGRGDAVNLLVDVAHASGDVPFHVQLLQSLAAPFGGSSSLGSPSVGWQELGALRRLAGDIHLIVTRAQPAERGPVWQRLSNAYDHYREFRAGGSPEATQQLGRIPFAEPAQPCGDPDCRACWLPPGDPGPLAPGVDPDQWFAGNPPRPCPRQSKDTPVPPERCTAPATAVIEAYSPAEGRLHGSLDESRYACPDHVTAVTEAIQAAGMTAHRGTDQVPHAGRVCGEVFDYRDLSCRREAGQ